MLMLAVGGLIIAVVCGTVLGFILANLRARIEIASLQQQLRSTEASRQEAATQATLLEQQLRSERDARTSAEIRASTAEQQAKDREMQLRELQEQLSETNRRAQQFELEVTALIKQAEAQAEKMAWLQDARKELEDKFKALAAETLEANAVQFRTRSEEQLKTLFEAVRGDWNLQRHELKQMVTPLGEKLEKLDREVRELESKREGAYQGLTQQIKGLVETSLHLQDTTRTLATALKSPVARGRWGEVQLRRIVELAGMVEHVNFEEQSATSEGDGRPDMAVHLANGRVLFVDAKAPMGAYLEAVELTDENARKLKLAEHARALRDRIRELTRKAYWRDQRTPEMVIMFVPSEAALASAFEHDATLFEFSAEQRVLIATPVILLGLLKAIAYGWQQHQFTEQAVEILNSARELNKRLVNFLGHLEKMRRDLDTTVQTFNKAVGSLESRLMPAARRFITQGGFSETPPEIRQIENVPRPLPQNALTDTSETETDEGD